MSFRTLDRIVFLAGGLAIMGLTWPPTWHVLLLWPVLGVVSVTSYTRALFGDDADVGVLWRKL